MMKCALQFRAFAVLATVLAAILTSCVPAFAQTRPTGDPSMYLDRVKEAVGQLALSNSQRAEVDKIFKQASDDITNAAPDLQNASPEDKASKYREILGGRPRPGGEGSHRRSETAAAG